MLRILNKYKINNKDQIKEEIYSDNTAFQLI